MADMRSCLKKTIWLCGGQTVGRQTAAGNPLFRSCCSNPRLRDGGSSDEVGSSAGGEKCSCVGQGGLSEEVMVRLGLNVE